MHHEVFILLNIPNYIYVHDPIKVTKKHIENNRIQVIISGI